MCTHPRALDSGEVLSGRYVLRERLGEGSMGVVFRADQPARGRSVAIKVLRPELHASEWGVRRFCDEAMAASRVKHPGAVTVIECDLTGETPFIAMAHARGRPLGGLVEEELSVPRALAIIDQLLDVLDAVHLVGVAHGDVKSDNVLVERCARGDAVTLIDFGLACLDGAWREAELVFGTPEYMAPEIIRGERPTAASDLYGVGVILYELLTGAPPFGGGPPADICASHLRALPTPPSVRRRTRDLPDSIDEIVQRALAKDPGERFSDARELQRALRTAARLDGRGAFAGAAPARPRSRSLSGEIVTPDDLMWRAMCLRAASRA